MKRSSLLYNLSKVLDLNSAKTNLTKGDMAIKNAIYVPGKVFVKPEIGVKP